MFCFSTSPQTTSTFPRSKFSKKACSNSPERSSWLPTTAFSSTGFQLLSLDSTVSAAPNVSPIIFSGKDGKRKTSVPAPSPWVIGDQRKLPIANCRRQRLDSSFSTGRRKKEAYFQGNA